MLSGLGGGYPLFAQLVSLPQPQLITDQQGLPQSFIPAIVQDHQGFIWMATRDGLCRYDGTRFKVFRSQAGGRPSLSFSGIHTLKIDTHSRLWILSEQADIDIFEPRTETFTNVSRWPSFRRTFGRYGISSLYIDPQDRLWIGLQTKEKTGGEGLVCFDTRTLRYHWFRHQPGQPHSLSDDRIKDIIQDQKGVIWVATAAGVDWFEPSTGQFSHLLPPTAALQAFGHDGLTSLFNGPTGELLIGSLTGLTVANATRARLRFYPLPNLGDDWWGLQFAIDPRGGVFLANRSHLFHYLPDQPPRRVVRSNQPLGRCLSLLVDHSDVLWLGTDGKGVDKYDLRAYPFQTAPYQVGFQVDLLTRYLKVPAEQALAIRSASPYFFRSTPDGQGKLWLNVGSSTFYQIDLTSNQCRIVPFPASFKETVTPLVTDERGRVWTLYDQHLWFYETRQQRWMSAPLQTDWKRLGIVLQAVADGQAFWLATETNGLFRLDRQTGQLQQYSYQANQPTSISSNALLCLAADPTDPDRLWVGTFGSGLCVFSKRSGTCQRLTTQQGLPNDVIYSALPDRRGNIWIGTNKGLCRLQARSFQVRTYTRDDGLLADEFNRFHYLRLPRPVRRSDGTTDDLVIMAGLDGFTTFYPDQLRDDMFKPAVELTTLSINNRLIETSTDPALGNRPIQALDQMSLPYHQNFITLGFAALQFNRPTRNSYRYRLEGLEENWVETSQPQAVYTDLRPGSYTFWVNASNTSGHWSPYVRKLRITIQPPPWATGWAYTFYALLMGSLVWYGISAYLNRLRLQQAVALRQQEAQQLRALDEAKSRFFTNITHEFRTPLTLILSPTESLLAELGQTPYQKRLAAISRHGRQLLGLINQLLDLAKLDARALSIDESPGLLSDFIAQGVAAFGEQAQAGGIHLTYQSELQGFYWFDADKVSKILSNLVSNAIKGTPPGGQVVVELAAMDRAAVDRAAMDRATMDRATTERDAAETVVLRVSDTGVGISADQLSRIFDRFYQVEGSISRQQGGTGIGLALVKELVDLQGGQIEVTSYPDQGTFFTIQLPYRRVVASSVSTPAPSPDQSDGIETPAHPDDPSASILVVEDHAELAELVVQSLPASYQISRAVNGQQGLEMASQLLPDLIISDVLMPVLDGVVLCQRLKANLTTNHIPVILLTAKSAHQSRIEGLSAGADDYLTKPFHPHELRLRVRNLLARQQRHRDWVQQRLTQLDQVQQPLPAQDALLNNLYALLERRLDDSSYSVEQVSDELGLSRSTLYRKVKALTGLSPTDLVRHYRLKRAAQYLRQGQTSSQTAYLTGFDTPSYFARCFREVYQLSPTEYAHRVS